EGSPETLNKALPIPLYHQLKTILVNHIESGSWKPDDQLPTEADLAARFGVSKITVRQALRDLVQLGYIRREQGRGTFVATPQLQQGPRELTSFSEELRRRGLRPESRVLEKGIVEATPEIGVALEIAEKTKVFRLKRLRLADGEPMGIQTVHIPMDLAPGLTEEPFESQSLYEILQSKYGLYPATARETHFAATVGWEEAELLHVEAGVPALSAERVTYLRGGRPLEYATSVMRGDRYRIVLELAADQHVNRESH
ncbi:MAG TPA: GntR family transcriptional regulator, partial [Bryobacteraceae bacterium]|nr:GntR family transcriptional regulator [Bryobacteraceae bacterium]